MKSYLYSLPLTCMFLVSCVNQQAENRDIEPVHLSSDTVISEYEDSLIVPPEVVCMNATKKGIFFTDYEKGLFVMDNSMNIHHQLGKYGRGQGELLGAAFFYTDNGDSVYIVNEGRQAFGLFTNGTYSKNIAFCEGARFTIRSRFFVQEQTVYHSVAKAGNPVIAYRGDSTGFRSVCDYTPHDDMELQIHSGRHVVKGSDSFFVIGISLPILQEYTFDGKLCAEYDLLSIPGIAKSIKEHEDEPKQPNSYYVTVRDAYYCDNSLYLLVTTDANDEYRCNTIYRLNTEDGNFRHVSTYLLQGDVFGTFCVSGNRIYAYDQMESSIHVYTMKQEEQ